MYIAKQGSLCFFDQYLHLAIRIIISRINIQQSILRKKSADCILHSSIDNPIVHYFFSIIMCMIDSLVVGEIGSCDCELCLDVVPSVLSVADVVEELDVVGGISTLNFSSSIIKTMVNNGGSYYVS